MYHSQIEGSYNVVIQGNGVTVIITNGVVTGIQTKDPSLTVDMLNHGLTQLTALLQSRQSIALFGGERTGKTTLLHLLRDWATPQRGFDITVFVDMQGLRCDSDFWDVFQSQCPTLPDCKPVSLQRLVRAQRVLLLVDQGEAMCARQDERGKNGFSRLLRSQWRSYCELPPNPMQLVFVTRSNPRQLFPPAQAHETSDLFHMLVPHELKQP